jgi:hypothetical protein
MIHLMEAKQEKQIRSANQQKKTECAEFESGEKRVKKNCVSG